MPPAIELDHVSKHYRTGGTVAALTDVSVTVTAGEAVAVMGASGSGKSTLLNVIGGLDVPTSGRIRVEGVDLAAMSEAQRAVWRRSAVAYVFQAYHLLGTLTCRDNVGLPLFLQHRTRTDVDRLVAAALDDVGLSARASHLPDELSGGERQRVAIARALATRARVLLADEPTGNLDSTTGQQILSLLLAVTRARQATLVMVTHNADAAAACDRVIRLADGRVASADRP